ncbi:hypothetical protein BDE36_1766 [Arcticibacter tournemirensis]|uniref:Uncharacterized protein n=1 Tax=Arcticibacter tournemirensis TaxID=699437 RepID=A0A5M9HFR7_9SPHI|nr:hypothetical protein [Arcticibacter tournemirensis]KAA8483767.1 hypothetical protein F1649_07720 [Arcticibacter tournemirensis]TQM50031.1 hypothetical protein BDE36_1766 [Arcticibacter tournemirensis]
MAVTILQAPPAIAFSGNFIPVRLQTNNKLQEAGVKSVNIIEFFPTVIPYTIHIKYGGVEIIMQADQFPDGSGTQFPFNGGLAGADYAALILPYFQANFTLSRDFDITAEISNSGAGSRLKFIAKNARYGYDFEYQGAGEEYTVDNITPGITDVYRHNFAIYFELWCEKSNYSGFEQIYSGRLPVNPNGLGNIADIDLSDLLHSYIENAGFDMPEFNSTNPLLCTNTCRRYYFRYAESWGDPVTYQGISQSPTYTAIFGKFSYVGAVENTLESVLQPGLPSADRFLKQGSATISTLPAQPQFIYFLNSRAEALGAKLKINFYTANDPEPILKTVVFDCLQYRKYAFNMRFDQIFNKTDHPGITVLRYEVWLENAAGSNISQVYTYNVDYSVQLSVRYFLYLGSWGGIETLSTFGKAEMKQELNSSEAQRPLKSGYGLPSGDTVVFDIKMQDSFKVPTGWINKPDLIQLRDFLTASKKYRYNKGRMLPISITSKMLTEMKDGEYLYAQSLEYKYLISDDAYTERTTDEAEQFVDPPKILPVYYGPANAVPGDEEAVKALPSSVSESTYELTINTGLNRIIILAIPSTKSVHSIHDVQSGESLTLSYAQVGTLMIDESPYKILALQNALSYSYNHEHIITLKNG